MDEDISRPSSLAALQLADREDLRIVLKPRMGKASFANWLFRMQRDHGFPEPVRLGGRSCAWEVHAVKMWLAGRPRKGVFSGRHRVTTSPEAA